MPERYPMNYRLSVLDFMAERQCGAFTASKHFDCSEAAIRRWKRTREKWEPHARLVASLRVYEGDGEDDPNARTRSIELTTANTIRSIIVRNLNFLENDGSIGSSSHYRAAQTLTLLTKEYPQVLATTQPNLSALVGETKPDEETSAADEWLDVQLRVLAGGVTGEAK